MEWLSVYILTFNCARTLIQTDVFATYLFDALPGSQSQDTPELPDLVVLSLQEVAPIGYSFLGGSYLVPYFDAFRQAFKIASKRGNASYVNTIVRNVGMTAIMVFARQDTASRLSWLETAGVGVGVHEMGNKGAVGVRLGYLAEEDNDETVEMTFVAAHLAPMEDALERRNEDWKSIVQGMVFSKTSIESGKLGDHDEQSEEAPLLQGLPRADTDASSGMYAPRSHLFFAGDLNYRTSNVKPGPEDYNAFPQPTSDIKDPKHYSHLLKKDQLTREIKQHQTLHELTEASIDFPPTYKYSNQPRTAAQVDDVEEWNWAKHRWPSWCDRILYLDATSWFKNAPTSAKIEMHVYKALPLFLTSDHRPVALSLSIPLKSSASPDADDIRVKAPFDIDPQWKEKRVTARRKEILVGLVAYLALTWEGNGLVLATLIGAVGGWLIIRSLLAV